jgi:hypothetical protein
MSKAKDRALEKYPLMADNDKDGLEALKYIGMECECVSTFNEVQEAKQEYFIEGYEQAEKDLELTWKDMSLIRLVFDAIESNINLGILKISPMTKEYYQEALKQYKEIK